VAKYLEKYGQVLVTNYRDFLLVTRGPDGTAIHGEGYRLAVSEQVFWGTVTAQAHQTAQDHGERFIEYLKRVLLHAAPLAAPQDVAWFLASYARDAKSRIEHHDLPALAQVRTALEEALGITFQGERGDHFFRSTLVQTLFYGVFSAWVLWSKEQAPADRNARFDWRTAAHYLHVPMIAALFEQVSLPSRLKPLGLDEVLGWAGDALNRVDRAAFFERFAQEQAVQYFYEPFLRAFDPELRKELGVWYTPPEIVRYMVARVDTVLRDELGIADGLADERVYVLDPCCGTGAYLVEVLRRIGDTLEAKGGDALGGSDLKKAATERVFGFEILPAPFVVAHLQLGLLLANKGAPLSDERQERAGVYLTNALTGWEPPREPQNRLLFPELEQERDAAEQVKRERPILVILGNPPYNGFAGLAVAEERDLSNAYRTTKRAPAPQGQGLNDLYVRFFRMAERRIVEKTGQGVVCFISNYSWLDGLSFTGMRERYAEVFDRIWIDNLNGDKYKTGKLTPEGLPDPSVFSTEFNREGIQVGTAIALLMRKKVHDSATAQAHYRPFWGRAKRTELLESLGANVGPAYQTLTPPLPLGLPFVPMAHGGDYASWPRLPDLFPLSFPGVKTSRDDVVVDIDRDRLAERMKHYFDPAVSDEEMRQISPGAMESVGRFDATASRQHLLKRGVLLNNIVRYCYRPFDVRWLYWEPETKLLDEKRSDYFPQVFDSNRFIALAQRVRRVWHPPQIVQPIADMVLTDPSTGCFPLSLRVHPSAGLFNEEMGCPAKGDEVRWNLSDRAQEYLAVLDADSESLFYHAVAMLHAPAYRDGNAGALQQDWPRVPLSATRDALQASAALGRQITALLDTEADVPGVTTGDIRPELRPVAVLSRVGGGTLDPDAGHLALTAGWGYGGKGGITMPGKGKVTTRAAEGDPVLGETTLDVYLNGTAYWRNVPARVWEYTIGGYQVVKKWLSYRERTLLGRDLTVPEAREVTAMARRIAAILLLEPALDANYAAVKQNAAPWPVPGPPAA
jgi:hypothetical protein